MIEMFRMKYEEVIICIIDNKRTMRKRVVLENNQISWFMLNEYNTWMFVPLIDDERELEKQYQKLINND